MSPATPSTIGRGGCAARVMTSAGPTNQAQPDGLRALGGTDFRRDRAWQLHQAARRSSSTQVITNQIQIAMYGGYHSTSTDQTNRAATRRIPLTMPSHASQRGKTP